MFKLFFAYCLIGFTATASAEIVQWKDQDGKVHFGEKNADTDKKNIQSVEIHDKYHIPAVESQTAIKYSGATAHRLVSFNSIKLSLQNSDIENVRVGRIVCGTAIDLYWQKGIVDLVSPQVIQGSLSKFSEFGYSVRNGIKNSGSPSSLSLDAEIVDLKFNMCPSNHSKDVSQNATYLKIKWSLVDPLSGALLFSGESIGAHDALSSKPVKGGTDVSFAEALAVATNNLLADRSFVKILVPVDMKTLAKKFDEKIAVHIQYGLGTSSFKSQADTLLKNTVIVKTKTGFGSGVVINSDGYVLTNSHVVGTEKTFTVLINGESSNAELVRNESVRDVALIKITGDVSGLSGVKVGRENPKIGDAIFIIGAPLALENSQTTTKGIVSAFRDMQGLKYLQTDAAINHGSSGGPVFNEQGELIALTVAGLFTRDGAGLSINYLIPIDDTFRYLNLDGAINENKAIATANTWVDGLPVSKDEDSWFSRVRPFITAAIDWLNSPLISLSISTSPEKPTPSSEQPLPKASGMDTAQEKIQQSYLTRANFSKALVSVNFLRGSLVEYRNEHEQWPTDFSDMDVDAATLRSEGVIDSVELQQDGTLHVVLSAATFGADQYFELSPDASNTSMINWDCKTTLPKSARAGGCEGF